MVNEYDTYVKNAAVTLTGEYSWEELNHSNVAEVLQNFIEAGQELDKLKKAFAYGGNRIDVFNSITGCPQSPAFKIRDLTPEECDMLHAILGIATEGVELVQAANLALTNNGKFDIVNIKEEVGDIFWYIALLVTDYKTLLAIWKKNINKLFVRFKGKFDEKLSRDEVRNLEAEREILEA